MEVVKLCRREGAVGLRDARDQGRGMLFQGYLMPGDGVNLELRAPEVDLALLIAHVLDELLELSLLPGDLICKGFIPRAADRELRSPEGVIFADQGGEILL